jgi:hypothetical protein
MTGRPITPPSQLPASVEPLELIGSPDGTARLVAPKGSPSGRSCDACSECSRVVDYRVGPEVYSVVSLNPEVRWPCPATYATSPGQFNDKYRFQVQALDCDVQAMSQVAWVQVGSPITSGFTAAINQSVATYGDFYYSGRGGYRFNSTGNSNLKHWQARCNQGVPPLASGNVSYADFVSQLPVSTTIGGVDFDAKIQTGFNGSPTTQDLRGVQVLTVSAHKSGSTVLYTVWSWYITPGTVQAYQGNFASNNLPATPGSDYLKSITMLIDCKQVPDEDGLAMQRLFGPNPDGLTEQLPTPQSSMKAFSGVVRASETGLLVTTRTGNNSTFRRRNGGSRTDYQGQIADDPAYYSIMSGGTGDWQYAYIPGVS